MLMDLNFSFKRVCVCGWASHSCYYIDSNSIIESMQFYICLRLSATCECDTIGGKVEQNYFQLI